MILDLVDLEDRALEFLRRHRIEHWLRAFQRELHVAGETVLRQGDRGDAAYVIVGGHAAVLSRDGASSAQLGPGELFGELALLTDRGLGIDPIGLRVLQAQESSLREETT